LFNRIRAGILWSKAIGEIRSGNGKAAISLIEEMGRLTSLRPYHIVMLAHAEIVDDCYDKAQIYLKRALSMMTNNESANARYLKLHAMALLSLVEGAGNYDDLAREAAAIPCKPRLKRWFQTPKRPHES
jgi:hypothetical protein